MELIEEYSRKKNYYYGIASRLEAAYDKITPIMSDHRSNKAEILRILRNQTWKGKTEKDFEDLLDCLYEMADHHEDIIDDIHDGINREKQYAKNQVLHFGMLIESLITEGQNLTN